MINKLVNDQDTELGSWIYGNLSISIALILLLFIATVLVVGRLDTIWGFREEELRISAVFNTVIRGILSIFKRSMTN